MTLQQTLDRLRTQLPPNLHAILDWMQHAAQFRCVVGREPAYDFHEAARRLIQEDPARAAVILTVLAGSHPVVAHTLCRELRGEQPICRPPVAPVEPLRTEAGSFAPVLPPPTSNEGAKPDLRRGPLVMATAVAILVSSAMVSLWALLQVLGWLRGLWS